MLPHAVAKQNHARVTPASTDGQTEAQERKETLTHVSIHGPKAIAINSEKGLPSRRGSDFVVRSTRPQPPQRGHPGQSIAV